MSEGTQTQHQEENSEERSYWFNVCSSLQSYKQFVENDMRKRQRRLNNLPEKYISKLPNETFEQMWAIDQAADYNQAFLNDVAQFQKSVMAQQGMNVTNFPDSQHKGKITASDQHRNTAILHSLYREWSIEGAPERNQSFEPLLNALKKHLPVNSTNIYKQKVVVPGCGLGRLPLEISAMGYCCQGNEYSAYMAAPSNYVLNQIIQPNSYTIHPWLDKVCNVVSAKDVLEKITVPDITADDMLCRGKDVLSALSTDGLTNIDAVKKPRGDMKETTDDEDFPKFSMGIGNFVEIYGDTSECGRWDGCATCFFLDTAPVVMEYVETIHRALRSGGVWTNIGPLLYHWVEDTEQNNDDRFQKSVEV